ncbi:MAG: YabP/YqfC family sporulation protein [Clostridia bacterium]|nr:YabP/YqfC family sporulation protein [Clostridia bacterium]
MSHNSKKTAGFLTRLAKSLDFPCDTFGNIPSLEIKGNFEATAYGCTKVLDYSTDTVKLATVKQNIIFEGRNLILSDFTAGAISVMGQIESVRFTDND